MRERALTPIQKLIISISLIIFLIMIGTVGLTLMEKQLTLFESLYFTVITISTVGFGEVVELHQHSRLFIIFLIVFSVITTTFAVSAIGQIVLEGQLRAILGRRKMKSKISKLSEHYIVAGFGRVGRQVIDAYRRRNVPFIILESDENVINRLEEEGILYVQGRATEDDVLIKAGVDKAKVLVSTLPVEADNVYLALTARDMNPSLYIICRADNPEGEKKLKRAGANNVVSPHILGGNRMAMASLRPNVVDFMQMTAMGEAGLGIEEVRLPAESRFSGQTLIDSKIKPEFGVTVIGIRKPDKRMIINPSPDEKMEANDILVLVGKTDELEKFTAEMA